MQDQPTVENKRADEYKSAHRVEVILPSLGVYKREVRHAAASKERAQVTGGKTVKLANELTTWPHLTLSRSARYGQSSAAGDAHLHACSSRASDTTLFVR